jgi:hypothetical protein
MKETVQVDPPALLGRRARIVEFKSYVESNRKELTPKVLCSRYALKTGISIRTVLGYLNLFYDAGLYRKPSYHSDWKLLTPEEYEVARKAKEAEDKQKQKEVDFELYDE